MEDTRKKSTHKKNSSSSSNNTKSVWCVVRLALYTILGICLIYTCVRSQELLCLCVFDFIHTPSSIFQSRWNRDFHLQLRPYTTDACRILLGCDIQLYTCNKNKCRKKSAGNVMICVNETNTPPPTTTVTKTDIFKAQQRIRFWRWTEMEKHVMALMVVLSIEREHELQECLLIELHGKCIARRMRSPSNKDYVMRRIFTSHEATKKKCYFCPNSTCSSMCVW